MQQMYISFLKNLSIHFAADVNSAYKVICITVSMWYMIFITLIKIGLLSKPAVLIDLLVSYN